MPDVNAQEAAAQPVLDRENQGVTTSPPADGATLCLSGGGYRAMMFQVGVLWRLNEVGLLRRLSQVSSVSGGSITAALLGLRWSEIFSTGSPRSRFESLIVEPLRSLANKTIDAGSILSGIFMPFVTISDKIAAAYRDSLFGDSTLQNLPAKGQGPWFVINATNVQSGALWRFSRPFMGDYRVGIVPNPTVPLAQAVAASSAFPPFLSPARLALDPAKFKPDSGMKSKNGKSLQVEPYTSEVFLSDGGVYDNMGLEPAWKHFKTVLVSDAGAKAADEPVPEGDWGRHSIRINDLIDNQVRSLRKRQLIASYLAPDGDPNKRAGAYWGIRTDILDYGLSDPLPCPLGRTMRLAEIPTRLARMDAIDQERLINWGYAVCDAAVRRYVVQVIPDASSPPGPKFPFPSSGV